MLMPTVGAGAQVVPDTRWRTLTTPHVRVHYSPGLETLARRAAANAEWAWDALSAELVAPRGPVDIVIADNVDFTNGYATVFPTNRVVLYAHPPVDGTSLRFYGDWNQLLVTHELTHIFHLDRSRGIWRFGQRVFGRYPLLFPNSYSPAWVTEGLAVYYESRLTGYGRLAGTQHHALARAAALGGDIPTLDQLSLGTPRFPLGQAAYAYGSLLFEHLAQTRGDSTIPRFVEAYSRAPIPFLLDRAARKGFGISFQRAWRDYRDSLSREGLSSARPAPGWVDISRGGWAAANPRWRDSARVIYSANPARELSGVYQGAPGKRPRRLSRRNGTDDNAPLANGALVYSQLDYTSPFDVRSDLYRQSANGRVVRLTRGKRLTSADVRSDGRIVAVQAARGADAGATRLVLVSADGSSITPLAGESTEHWSDPRWSPDGARVVAVKRGPDGRAAVVVVDTVGAVRASLPAVRSVEQGPAWFPDGRTIVFASDRSGISQLYVAAVSDSSAAMGIPRQVTNAGAGVTDAAVSPSGTRLAAVERRSTGDHVGIFSFDLGAPPVGGDSSGSGGDTLSTTAIRSAVSPFAGRSTPYRSWRTLLPRYVLPVVTTGTSASTLYGLSTSGTDVIGRHAYFAQALLGTSGIREPELDAIYRFAGLGQPFIDMSVSQDWGSRAITDTGGRILGGLTQRRLRASAGASLVRPRFRSSSSVSLSGEIERKSFAASPASLAERLPERVLSTDFDYGLALSGGWSNTARPSLGISSERGLSMSGAARQRWRGGLSGQSVQGSARTYRALDLPGFAHHVLAARGAAAWASDSSLYGFDVGGTSGSSIELLPGLVVGDSPRSFGVRGYPVGAQRGVRALGGTVEYRAPLFQPARGFRLIPLFLSRTAAVVYADGASAWCPAGQSGCGTLQPPRRTLASAGAELLVDLALQYDSPYRFRIGVARALVDPESYGARALSAYFTLGLAF